MTNHSTNYLDSSWCLPSKSHYYSIALINKLCIELCHWCGRYLKLHAFWEEMCHRRRLGLPLATDLRGIFSINFPLTVLLLIAFRWKNLSITAGLGTFLHKNSILAKQIRCLGSRERQRFICNAFCSKVANDISWFLEGNGQSNVFKGLLHCPVFN